MEQEALLQEGRVLFSLNHTELSGKLNNSAVRQLNNQLQ
jgi:hypothetical protein